MRNVLAALVGVFVFYLILSFIRWDIDLLSWLRLLDMAQRGFFLASAGWFAGVAVFINRFFIRKE